LLAKQEELTIQEDEANILYRTHQNNHQIFALLDPIKKLSYVSIINSMLEHHRYLKQAENALSNLDLSDFNALEKELDERKADYSQFDQQGKDLLKALGGHQVELKKQKETVKKLDDAQDKLQDSLEQQEEKLLSFSCFSASTLFFKRFLMVSTSPRSWLIRLKNA